MKNAFILRILQGFALLLFLGVPTVMSFASSAETLIIFHKPGESAVERHFMADQLPEIRKIADRMGVDLRLVDIGDGAPMEVGLTPFLVYQNHMGRAIYQGRTTTYGRMRNFIRTFRFMPQKEAPHIFSQIPIWKQGRMKVYAPLKIAKVTGTIPQDYDHEKFTRMATKEIRRGFKSFKIRKDVSLKRTDRGFYMDFYPWLSGDGTLFLSLAMFSQFHCATPVYITGDSPITGPWKNRKTLFRQAASLLEAEVERYTKNGSSGDGFDPVTKKIPERSFTRLGFSLPPPPARSTGKKQFKGKLPTRWVTDLPGPGDPPLVRFWFPAPLDQYSGEVTAISGYLTLGRGRMLSGGTGMMEISPANDITLGDPVLDQAIGGSAILGVHRHPVIRYYMERIDGPARPLAMGQLLPAVISGTLELKGKREHLTCSGDAEAYIGEDGTPKLLIRCKFHLDLTRFNIEGAEGPEPARNTLMFDINLLLKDGGQALDHDFPEKKHYTQEEL